MVSSVCCARAKRYGALYAPQIFEMVVNRCVRFAALRVYCSRVSVYVYDRGVDLAFSGQVAVGALHMATIIL